MVTFPIKAIGIIEYTSLMGSDEHRTWKLLDQYGNKGPKWSESDLNAREIITNLILQRNLRRYTQGPIGYF